MTAKEELTWGFPFVEHTLDIVSQYQGEKEEKKRKMEEEEHKEGEKRRRKEKCGRGKGRVIQRPKAYRV